MVLIRWRISLVSGVSGQSAKSGAGNLYPSAPGTFWEGNAIAQFCWSWEFNANNAKIKTSEFSLQFTSFVFINPWCSMYSREQNRARKSKTISSNLNHSLVLAKRVITNCVKHFSKSGNRTPTRLRTCKEQNGRPKCQTWRVRFNHHMVSIQGCKPSIL